jgi:hypothetical protein
MVNRSEIDSLFLNLGDEVQASCEVVTVELACMQGVIPKHLLRLWDYHVDCSSFYQTTPPAPPPPILLIGHVPVPHRCMPPDPCATQW